MMYGKCFGQLTLKCCLTSLKQYKCCEIKNLEGYKMPSMILN